VLPCLQQLSHLSLHSAYDSIYHREHTPPEAFSNLTASTNLHYLSCHYPNFESNDLGPMRDYAFPPGRKMPQLTQLVADYSSPLLLGRLVQASPYLQDLFFHLDPLHSSRSLIPRRHAVTALQQLLQLTSLGLYGLGAHPASSGVLQPTRLRQLFIRSMEDLQPATAVRPVSHTIVRSS
jgi:hypothetical protein